MVRTRIENLEHDMREWRLQREAQIETHMREWRLQRQAQMEEIRQLLAHRTRHRRGRSRPIGKNCDGKGEIEGGQATKGKETNLTSKEEPPNDGSKVKIFTTSTTAPEQVPLHRPTTTATTPKPPEPLDDSNRVGADANREEEKEQERDICHPEQRCRPKLQDNSVGWGKLNSTPWVKKGSTKKKKKGENRQVCFIRRLPPQSNSPLSGDWARRVSNACVKISSAKKTERSAAARCIASEREKQNTGSKFQFQRFDQVGDLMGHAALLMGQAQFDEEKQGASMHKITGIATFTKRLGMVNKCYFNNFKIFGYFSFQQWDPGG